MKVPTKLKKTVKSLLRRKANVNYLSGLWLAIEIYEKNTRQVIVKINGQVMQVADVLIDQQTDIHLCVQKMASAISLSDVASVEIFNAQTEELLTQSQCPLGNIYEKEFQYIDGSINACISHIPLINIDSIKYLSTAKRLKVIEHLYAANLQKDCVKVLNLLISSLQQIDETYSFELMLPLKSNQEFNALLIEHMQGTIKSHPLSQYILDSLNSFMHLDAQSLINYSQLKADEKNYLLDNCVLKDQEKFNFIERFPDTDTETGSLTLWQELSEEQKSDYWPLLAISFEYNQQHERLVNYPVNFSWFLSELEGNHNEQVKTIVWDHNTRWFALSIILQEVLNDANIDDSINQLQAFVWANHTQGFINIDTFTFIVQKLLERSFDASQYEQLIAVTIDLFKSRQLNNENDLFRSPLIKLIADLINLGIAEMNWAFIKLGQCIRPYYALQLDFLNMLNYQPLKQFDNAHYEFSHYFYSTCREVVEYFNGLDVRNLPSDDSIRAIFSQLQYLSDNGVLNTDKWTLSLSRFCQSNQISELQPELALIHEKITDYYGALLLSTKQTEKLRLEKKITEANEHKKRNDSFWFDQALCARQSKNLSTNLLFVNDLYEFLLLGVKNKHPRNVDLIELLSSELIWCAINWADEAELKEKSQTYIEFLKNEYSAGASAFNIFLALNKTMPHDINTLSKIEKSCGEYGEFSWLINEFDVEKDELIDFSTVNKLLTGIRQHYLYPYTQVMIYSCNAYIESRHKVIRDSWLPNLTSLGIDYCFVVGDAEQSHYDGDMLRLKVLDTYEELPHKSVEMFSFVASNSHFRYHYKLDDDCVLNVKAMFSDPAFLNKDYFGRVVKRPVGGVDRSWHHQKSKTIEAKSALDLSPEESIYCDGSTGYILSHWAAEQLGKQAKEQANKQLISSSYFEDKLIGDLLYRAHVRHSDKGYNCVIRRKAALDRDLQMWDYGLLPTAKNSIKVLHSEDDHFRKKMGQTVANDNAPLPDLIYRDVTGTDLNPKWLSGTEQAPVLEKIKVNENAIMVSRHIAIIVGKNESELLPNLLAHHRSIGIEHFLFVDNCSVDESVEYMLQQEDVSVFIATQEYRFSRFGVNWQETLCSHYGLGRWVLIIDSDELYSYPDFENQKINMVTELANKEKANAIFSPMIDFYPEGALETADVTEPTPFYKTCTHFDSIETMKVQNKPVYGPFSNSKQLQGGLRGRLFGDYNVYPQPNYVNQKYNLLKYQPSMRLIEGLHFIQGHILAANSCSIMHFKYHAGFHNKVTREIASGQHWNGATEYKRYAKALESGASNVMFNKDFSQKYIGSKSFSKTIKG